MVNVALANVSVTASPPPPPPPPGVNWSSVATWNWYSVAPVQAVQSASKELSCGLERVSTGTVTGAAVTSTSKVADAVPSLFSAVRAMVYSPASA